MLVATVCGGSLALAVAGLLEGRHAVTHHLGMDLLDATGAPQRITRPMRLDLAVEVIVDGERMAGTSRAGRLPASTVTGTPTG